MSSADLLALAERVEAASGPDRELDALIAPLQGLQVVEEGHPIGRMCYDDIGAAYLLPRYTASLDAALTLVLGTTEYPNVKTFVIDCAGQTTVHMGACVAHVWSEHGKDTAKATTPALALCAAALKARARASQEPDNAG